MRTASASGIIALALGVTHCVAEDVRRVPPALVDAVREHGVIRVIVQVARPAGTPIAQVQDAVLAELAGTGHRVLHRYLNSPALAVEVNEEALRVLAGSRHVLSIARDFELRPTTPGRPGLDK